MQGLRRCGMPDVGRYSHRFRFDVSERPNESIPESDAFYRLNMLLGLSPLPAAAGLEYLDVKSTYYRCCDQLRSPGVRVG
jgi:hypothetical protein